MGTGRAVGPDSSSRRGASPVMRLATSMSSTAATTGFRSSTATGPSCARSGIAGKRRGRSTSPTASRSIRKAACSSSTAAINRVLKYVPTEEEMNRGKDQPAHTVEAGAVQPPRSLAVKAGDTEVFLSWMEVPGAQSYNLYFSTSPHVTIEGATKIEGVTNPLHA